MWKTCSRKFSPACWHYDCPAEAAGALHNGGMPYMPTFVAPARFTDAAAALEQVQAIYQGGLAHLRESMLRFVAGEALPGRVRACYPFVRVHTHTVSRHTPPANAGLSYGFVAGPGRYETTLTRPDLFSRYYLEQFRLLLENHQVELEVGTSTQPIPIHFSFAENDHIEGTHERRAPRPDARRVRPARPGRDGRRHRQRHLRARGRRGAAAVALHRRAGGLLAAPPAPLHGHRARVVPELRAVHQLPVLHRRVRAPGPRGHGRIANSQYVAFIEPGNVVTRRRELPQVRALPTAPARRQPGHRAAAPAADAGLPPGARGLQRHHHGRTSASARPTPRPSPTTSRCCARMRG